MKYMIWSEYGEDSGILDDYKDTLKEWKDKIIKQKRKDRIEVLAFDESKGETPDDAKFILWLSVDMDENGELYWKEKKSIQLEFVTPVPGRNFKND
ncbi:hypothetical protein COL24_05450 [Bacillus toyonensis]|uniref:hypothetical protein n=1 Tax=Bacillus toyonensis TaxID=155322 RepID=UPI000BF96458|nr:hypothetical protein [Bacillus toyonensis]PFX43708.1 hypothetical protein COL24_05450 [Bacillus toyonensis]